GVVLGGGGDEQLFEQSRQFCVEAVTGRLLQGPVAALTGDGVDGSGGRADLHGPHLGEVARQGRLGDGDARGRQRLGEFDLASHGLAGDEIDDLLLPGGLRQRRGVRRGGTV